MYYTKFNSEICEIVLAGDEQGLRYLHMTTGEGKRTFKILPEWKRDDDYFSDTVRQLKEYFRGDRRVFDVKLAPEGTDFQKTVWAALLEIPYGECRSYGELAAELGNPNACRAVGGANGRNPIPLIIPCHRVIGRTGKLTGFAYGVEVKRKLLELEGIDCGINRL